MDYMTTNNKKIGELFVKSVLDKLKEATKNEFDKITIKDIFRLMKYGKYNTHRFIEDDFEIEVDDLGIWCPDCNNFVDPATACLHDHDIIQAMEGLKYVIFEKKWLSQYKKEKLICACEYIIEFCLENIDKVGSN